MGKATAWLLALGDGHHVAVGEREMVHMLDHPTLEPIPLTPRHCRHVVVWEDDVLPVMDLAVWVGMEGETTTRSVCVVAWQPNAAARARLGALAFSGMPVRCVVDDAQHCALPDTPAGWSTIAHACFEHDGRPVPILELPRLFSGVLR